MSLMRRISEPVRAPFRQLINHYSTFFEDLIHAVKSELVGKIEAVNARVDDVDRSVSTSHDAISDQMALQAATLRTLGAEVERLQDVVNRLGTDLGGSAVDIDGTVEVAAVTIDGAAGFGAMSGERPPATQSTPA